MPPCTRGHHPSTTAKYRESAGQAGLLPSQHTYLRSMRAAAWRPLRRRTAMAIADPWSSVDNRRSSHLVGDRELVGFAAESCASAWRRDEQPRPGLSHDGLVSERQTVP